MLVSLFSMVVLLEQALLLLLEQQQASLAMSMILPGFVYANSRHGHQVPSRVATRVEPGKEEEVKRGRKVRATRQRHTAIVRLVYPDWVEGKGGGKTFFSCLLHICRA